jgi:hypothetical protein
MDEVFLNALANRAKSNPEFLNQLPEDIRGQVEEKLNDN